MKLTSIRLLVSDFYACHKFYVDVMGFNPLFGDPDGPYEEFDTGNGAVLSLFKRELMAAAVDGMAEKAGKGCGDAAVFTLGVDDVDRVAADLAEKGVTFISDPHDQPEWRLRVVHFRDPCSNLIEINSPMKAYAEKGG